MSIRLLVVVPYAIWPPHTGGQRRVAELLAQLSTDFSITVFYPHLPGEHVGSAPFAVTSVAVEDPGLSIWQKFFHPLPDISRKRFPEKVLNAFTKTLRAVNPDIVWLEHSYAAAVLPLLSSGVPVVVGEQNIESKLYAENSRYRVPGYSRNRLRVAFEVRKISRLEVRAWTRAARVFAVNTEERKYIVDTVGAAQKVEVIPNGADFTQRVGVALPRRRELLFMGNLNHPPNRAGLLFFIEKILPTLTGHVHVRVCGSSARREWLQHTGVTDEGEVEDVIPLLRSVSGMIVPLPPGGGTRLKIIEAWAQHCPVISTIAGAAGLNAIPGQHYLKAETPTEWAQAIDTLLNTDSGKRIAETAYAFGARHFSWEGIGHRVEQTLKGVIGG